MVAPLLAARRGRGGSLIEYVGGTPQAIALLKRLIGCLEVRARSVVEAHLDQFLDGLTLPDEEAMTTILMSFRKFRFLGRFFLQKGTARVSQRASEAAMSSYKHLSTSLQILLEAAQHFSRGEAYNHCLTSLELAALLKQRMAKLHSSA